MAACNLMGLNLNFSTDKALSVLKDIWGTMRDTGADWSVALAFFMISASWVAVELIKVLTSPTFKKLDTCILCTITLQTVYFSM